MTNQKVSEPVMANDGQIADIQKTINEALPQIWAVLTFTDAQTLIGNKDEFNAGIRRAFEPFVKTKTARYWLDEMARFHQEVFGLEADYTNLKVPVSRDGFNWLLVFDERISTEMAYQKAKERFPSWKYCGDQSLNEAIPTDAQDQTSGTVAVWLRDGVEVDEVHRGKSANQIKQEGVKSLTARRRIILELWYEWKNPGQHLDRKTITLCAASRSAGGHVPLCRWYDGGFCVDWCGPGYADADLGVREEVS